MLDSERLLNKLERQFGRHGLPNVTVYFIMLQVGFYVLSLGRPELLSGAMLIPNLVLEGQVWRLISFLGVPPVTNPIFAFFFWYLFYLMGYRIYLPQGFPEYFFKEHLHFFEKKINSYTMYKLFCELFKV